MSPTLQDVLLLIDVQNDYFPGGTMELEGQDAAAANCARLLARFRERELPVVHIRHESIRPGSTFFLPGTEGAEIHESVAPLPSEPVITKHYPNAFRGTGLSMVLLPLHSKRLIVAGSMSHMCIDATVRAAFDLGHSCTVAYDACATRTLSFNGADIPAAQVHGSFMAALGQAFAEVVDTETILGEV